MKQVPLRDLFLTFAKIGAFTIGGGAAMIALLREEIVKRGWISDEEFPDILAIAQSSPGLLAVNFSIFAGYRIRGTKGSIVATIGSCIPPFLIILLIAMFFSGFRDNPTVMSIFRGIRPAVTAIIAVPMIQMAMETNHSRWAWAATLAVLGLVAFLKISPIWILLVTILVSFAIALYRDKREGRRK